MKPLLDATPIQTTMCVVVCLGYVFGRRVCVWWFGSFLFYLVVDFTSNGAWDEHVKRVLQNGRKKISQVHSNRDILT